MLIIDDEPDLCWALERMLRTSGVTINVVGSSAAALALLRQQSYALAFIDAILPDGNGIQLAEQIYTYSPQTELVIMSGYYYQDDSCLSRVPLLGFLAKPFLRSEVRALFEHVLVNDRYRHGECVCHTSC
ncbi:MAG: response regulator [Oscillochloris sp.]|nr:response regulator [Oscillochloris sp.]